MPTSPNKSEGFHELEKDQKYPPITLPNEDDPDAQFGPAPDGGGRAWLVATGAAFIFFAALGYANSFGVFQEYYLRHQLKDQSADDVAWIGSVSVFLQFGIGTIAAPLFDRYGAWIIRPAALLLILSMLLTSLCTAYYQFMLCQGILTGLCMGLLIFPALASVSQYFDKKRAAALGLAVSGSSIGGVIFPIAFSKMLNASSLSFGWTVRIIGFAIIPLLGFACFAVTARLPSRTTRFFIPGAFREPGFLLLVVSMFFMNLGMFMPLFFLPTYAVSRGMETALASYLLAILNAASTFGRIIPGVLADKFGRLNVLSLSGIATGITIMCMSKAASTAGLVMYSIVVGFFSGALISGGSAAFSMCPKDPRDIGTYLGMGLGVSSVAVLIGPPINGRLLDRYGVLEMTIFSGVICLAGGSAALLSKIATPQGIWGRR